MLSRPEGPTLSFANASIVFADEVLANGHLSVVDGTINAVDGGLAPSVAIDLEGENQASLTTCDGLIKYNEGLRLARQDHLQKLSNLPTNRYNFLFL